MRPIDADFASDPRRSRGGAEKEGGKTVNTEVIFLSKSEMWETPQDFFDKLNEEFHFDLDVCALHENEKCENYYTPEMDRLSLPWEGVCWCNPPYGREIGSWVRRAWLLSSAENTVVMLLPARTDTRWFHDYIYQKSRVEVRFIKGRLKFGGSKNSAPFPSMVVIFRPDGTAVLPISEWRLADKALDKLYEKEEENG